VPVFVGEIKPEAQPEIRNSAPGIKPIEGKRGLNQK
jgi:LDH2 family malate/lactate/ureidoglycolate dehydrogenase